MRFSCFVLPSLTDTHTHTRRRRSRVERVMATVIVLADRLPVPSVYDAHHTTQLHPNWTELYQISTCLF